MFIFKSKPVNGTKQAKCRSDRIEGHPTTRIKQSYCYATPSSKNAKDFLINHLIPTLPFNIKSIQVDGGSENED